jgi:hypothetical protein
MKDEDLFELAKLLEENEMNRPLSLPQKTNTGALVPEIQGSPSISKAREKEVFDFLEREFTPEIPTTLTNKAQAGMIGEGTEKAAKGLGKQFVDKMLNKGAKAAGGLFGLAAEAADAETFGPEEGFFDKLTDKLSGSSEVDNELRNKGFYIQKAGSTDNEIIEDPTAPLEMRQQALQRMKNKYLKPEEDNKKFMFKNKLY